MNYVLPTTFAVGERFEVRGRLNTAAGIAGVRVNLQFMRKDNTSRVFGFSTLVLSSLVNFTITLDTNNFLTGDYYLALYTGSSLVSVPTTPLYTFLAPQT